MSTRNRDIAAMFQRLADLLEIEGDNPFRIRAYRNAADTVTGLSHALTDLVAAGADLTEYPHIGEEIAEKIATIVETGRLPALDEVAARVPPELSDLMQVKGLGPKGVKALYEAFRIRSLDDLEQVAEAGRVRELDGFGAKKEQALLEGIRRLRAAGPRRTRIDQAEQLAEPLREWLAGVDGVERIEIAGSYRRRRETVGDLDILVACDDGAGVMQRLVDYDEVEAVVSHGSTRSTVRLAGGLQVDVRAVEPASFGAALVYFTGSKAHNVELRQRAGERDWKLNEYGLFGGDERIAGGSEEAVYRQLGLDWIPPELREDRGEIGLAEAGRLPALIEAADLRGNLHAHTTWSDGRDSLEAMAAAARERGLEYLAITDHGPKVKVANGLDAKRLREQANAIAKLDAELDDLALLRGCEVDILADGRLDLDDEVLAELEVVVCSIHYNLNLSREEQTRRVLRAMDNPHFMIWGHPTAREIGRREPIDIDLEACLAAA
ncbi:MAG: DNA polymerase/3'-5' exonuclease PolX, partial [Halofilum sp. (in: g-proteobacteria)]|nr:DNA polymerase/3'-5' exonuclease PolX [Halofilum sp. (in: g-proteobacteria)]